MKVWLSQKITLLREPSFLLYLDLSRTRDGMGYFGYNKHFQAYIEVISYDQLVDMAMERNRAFFDKLGLPSS